MTPDYEKLLDGYPNYISKEQMRLICHISKKTARLLLQTGLVPCVVSDRQTHTYKIAKSDIIEYLRQREVTPERYAMPAGSYIKNPDYLLESSANYDDTFLIDLSRVEECPDVLSTQEASELSGVSIQTVAAWARKKLITAFIRNGVYYIPKLTLIEYLQSPNHRRNSIRQKNIGIARAFREAEITRQSDDYKCADVELPEENPALLVEVDDDSMETMADELPLIAEHPDLLTIQQASMLASVEPDVVKGWVADKLLKAFMKNRVYHIPKTALIELLEILQTQLHI